MTLHRSLPRTAAKIVASAAALVVILSTALAVFVTTFDWNRARPWIDDKLTQALGRPFAINGDLRVDWHHPASETGWRAWLPWPRLSAKDVTLGNPSWAKAPHFVTLDEIAFNVEVLPLIGRKIVIPSIDLTNPSVDLERQADGRNNWTFEFAPSEGPSRWSLQLRNLGFAQGRVALSDEQKHIDLQAVIDTLGQPLALGDVLAQQEASSRSASAQVVGEHGARALAAQAGAASVTTAASPGATTLPYALGWTVKGSYDRTPVSGTGKVGGVLALQAAAQPFPLQADVKIGDTRLAVVGTLTDPAHLAALDLRLWLQGTSMAHLYAITGVTLPDTPPYATDGRLVGRFGADGNVFEYTGFTGRVGGSDLSGSLTYAAREPRPLLSGELVSNLLQFSDLAPIVGADTNASKAQRGDTVKQPPNRVLPLEPFRTDRWKSIDADVKFTGRRIVKQADLPINHLYTHVVMNDGVLSFEPFKFGVAGGSLDANLHLDGSAVPLKARAGLSARHVKLRQLFPNTKTMQSALGEINGDASLTATGNSPAALAATADGEVKALVTEGTLSRFLMEAAGLNVANVVYEKLFDTADVKINCAAADFVATNGVLDTRTFALDTDDAVINMDGHIDLRDESMDLKIHPHTKGLRVFSARSPLYVKGTFKDPHAGVDVGALALRAGAMVGLGLVNPFAALVPLIVPSHGQETSCSALLEQMRTQSATGAPARAAKPASNPAAAALAGGGSRVAATDRKP